MFLVAASWVVFLPRHAATRTRIRCQLYTRHVKIVLRLHIGHSLIDTGLSMAFAYMHL